MMASESPYRLQIHLSHAMRRVLRSVAAKEDMTIQNLVTKILYDYLQRYPEGQELPPLDAG